MTAAIRNVRFEAREAEVWALYDYMWDAVRNPAYHSRGESCIAVFGGEETALWGATAFNQLNDQQRSDMAWAAYRGPRFSRIGEL